MAQAQGSFAGVQFTDNGDYTFFDSKTGEIWEYYLGGGGLVKKFRLTKLGQPLVKEK